MNSCWTEDGLRDDGIQGLSRGNQIDPDGEALHGIVVGARDVIFFEATSVEELKKVFRFSIDDYIASCEERGERPDVPFSGDISLGTRTIARGCICSLKCGLIKR